MTLLWLQGGDGEMELPVSDLATERLRDIDALLARVAGERVAGVVLGHGVDGPVHVSQRLRALDARLPIVLVVLPERLERTRANASLAPLVGEPIQCLSAVDAAGLGRVIAEIAAREPRSGIPDDGERKTPTHLPAARYLERVLEGPTGVLVADVAGRVVSMNRRACQILGVSEHEALGSELGALYKGLEEPAAAALLSGTGSRSLTRTSPDGGEQEVEVHAVSLDAPDHVGVVLTLVDATARRRAQQEVARKEKLQLDLLTMISHDIRAPLGVIVGAVNELSSKDVGELNDDQRFLLNLVRKSVERLTRLAANVVYLGRMESGRVSVNLRRAELRAVVRRAAEEIQRVDGGTSIAVRSFVPTEAVDADIDVERLEQVLANLLSNAVRFARKEVNVHLTTNGSQVVIEVVDDGPGIPDEALPTIFERFSRVEAPKSGTGLGLAIVRGIVQDHGGDVMAENQKSRSPDLRGARFTVRLPRYAVVPMGATPPLRK